jgi:nucleoside 2-deoxyribosyltransferase
MEGGLKVYLCGGINGLPDSECKDWRVAASRLLNCSTIDPMRRDYRGQEDAAWREIVEGDLNDIVASDIVLVNATRPSWGTAMEVAYAYKYGKPVIAFTWDSTVSPWLKYHATNITETLKEATKIINEWNSR